MNKNELYKTLPKVDDLLAREGIVDLSKELPNSIINEAINEILDGIRSKIKNSTEDELSKFSVNVDKIVQDILHYAGDLYADKLRPVVNASGVVIHTNLGRSVLSREAVKVAMDNACRYNNLELDLKSGKRGSRYQHLEDLICRVTGAEAAHVVNNNAAAVILVLSELAKGKNIPVSRGELVEIGGSFRVPEIMKLSSCELREIGCTNKTNIDDYRKAIDENTALLLKVHSSNYKILGFTDSPSLEELSELAKEKGIPFYYDIGSGSIFNLTELKSFEKPVDEPTVREAIERGVDIVSFSGDKLLGSAQAGIIVGKKEYIDRMKKNQLTRALRVDKIIISVLEQTFKAYLDTRLATKKIPTLSMLSMTEEETRNRVEALLSVLKEYEAFYRFEMVEDYSEVGGGSLPESRMKSVLLSVEAEGLSAEKLLKSLRDFETPIIARIKNDKVMIDTRALLEGDFEIIRRALYVIQSRSAS